MLDCFLIRIYKNGYGTHTVVLVNPHTEEELVALGPTLNSADKLVVENTIDNCRAQSIVGFIGRAIREVVEQEAIREEYGDFPYGSSAERNDEVVSPEELAEASKLEEEEAERERRAEDEYIERDIERQEQEARGEL